MRPAAFLDNLTIDELEEGLGGERHAPPDFDMMGSGERRSRVTSRDWGWWEQVRTEKKTLPNQEVHLEKRCLSPTYRSTETGPLLATIGQRFAPTTTTTMRSQHWVCRQKSPRGMTHEKAPTMRQHMCCPEDSAVSGCDVCLSVVLRPPRLRVTLEGSQHLS